MIQKILVKIALSLVEKALSWVFSSLTKMYQDAKDQKEFEANNAGNLQKYESAKSRLEKIKAAEDLLNRAKPKPTP